jgi:hypothetical protein
MDPIEPSHPPVLEPIEPVNVRSTFVESWALRAAFFALVGFTLEMILVALNMPSTGVVVFVSILISGLCFEPAPWLANLLDKLRE